MAEEKPINEERVREIVKEEILKERLERAKAEVAHWYIHLVVYLVVNGAFSAYVLLTGGFFWPIFPIIFWGGGVVIHCIGVFGERRRLSKEVEALKKPKK